MEFDLELFLRIVIIGLANGSLIALVALGYTLVYGIVELINFAHGEVFMMGALFAVSIVTWTGVTRDSTWPSIGGVAMLALLGAMLFSASLNWSIDRIAYRRLRNAPRLAPLIAAIGFSFILQNIGIYWKGSNSFSPPPLLSLADRRTNILTEWFGLDTDVHASPMHFVALVLIIPLLLLLSWFVYRTRTGKAMRATAQDRDAAALMGIDTNRTIAVAFLLGGALAGAAGMIALYYNNQAKFDMGFKFGLFAFTAAVLGGIGNLSGAVLGGFIIGLVAALSDGFVRQYVDSWGSQWTSTVIFGVLVIMLIFRPSGLLGEHTPDKV